jgi:hypothetical protein
VGSLCALLAVLRPTLSVAVCVECMRDDAWYIIGLTLSISMYGCGFEIVRITAHAVVGTHTDTERRREVWCAGADLSDQGTAV